jgi:alpha-1,3-mannosyltransferase
MNEILSEQASRRVTAVYVMDTMLGSMVIGLLCARSIHYQFYAYIGWATPYLLWRSGLGPVWVFGNWAMQEFAWLAYPSTSLSSCVVVLQLGLAVASVWWGSGKQFAPPMPRRKADEKGHLE